MQIITVHFIAGFLCLCLIALVIAGFLPSREEVNVIEPGDLMEKSGLKTLEDFKKENGKEWNNARQMADRISKRVKEEAK